MLKTPSFLHELLTIVVWFLVKTWLRFLAACTECSGLIRQTDWPALTSYAIGFQIRTQRCGKRVRWLLSDALKWWLSPFFIGRRTGYLLSLKNGKLTSKLLSRFQLPGTNTAYGQSLSSAEQTGSLGRYLNYRKRLGDGGSVDFEFSNTKLSAANLKGHSML